VRDETNPVRSATVLRPEPRDGVGAGLTRLREEEPVTPMRMAGGDQVWLVSRHDDVHQGLLDPCLVTHGEVPGQREGPGATLDGGLLSVPPERHGPLRRLATPALGRRRLRRHRKAMARAAGRLLDQAAAEPVAELISAFARPFSFACLVDVFGVAPGHRDRLEAALTALFDRPADPPGAVVRAAAAVEDVVAAELGRRAAEPEAGDDVLSAIARAARKAEATDNFDPEDVRSLAGTLLMAAFDSTAQMLGLAVLTLLTHPRLRERAGADPGGRAALVEELLRWDSPGPFSTPRRATADLSLGGVRIPRGDTVILALGSGNRDPRRHAEPDRLDPGRGGGHLAFGAGRHACPGASLARTELEIGLSAFLDGYPGARLTVEPQELHRLGTMHRRLAALPVALAG
jgi:cytochrome P450